NRPSARHSLKRQVVRLAPIRSAEDPPMYLSRIAFVGCLLLFGAAVPGCSRGGRGPSEGFEVPMPAAPEQPGGRDEQAQAKGGEKEVSSRKIIYTANVRLVVEDFAKAEQQLEELVDAHKGHILKSGVQGSPGARRSGDWTVRVPVERFKKF